MSPKPTSTATSADKRRKLRHPRTSRACDFCRRRKTRCSGGTTCDLCAEHQVVCAYKEEPPPRGSTASASYRRSISDLSTPPTPKLTELPSIVTEHRHPATTILQNVDESGRSSRRPSAEPEATFHHGLHVGPTSGVAFLYRWQTDGVNEPAPETQSEVTPLSNYGDMFLPQVSKAQLPDMTEAAALIDHYFRFAMPTFRFLHQPTISRWMHTLIDRKPLEAIQAASVLIVLSHALMYSERAPTTSYRISDRSISYLQQAKALFSNEAGPAQVASVEARLATCLVLLSICHVNECRFLFGTTHTLVITLGLHRKTPKQFKMSPLESQRRKRVFWSFYAIDGYISVMLGQPRLLRDEDVDQEYPENIDDTVLDTATDVALCPHHGSMEASVFHAKLARLFARSNDLLYPIGHLSTVDIIQRSHGMVEMLNELERELPPYLQPRAAASLGTQTWDRQNSVLGLAIAHARILATRRSILLDITSTSLSPEDHEKYQTCLRTCLEAICAMIDRVHPMMLKQRLLWGFWLTLYSTTCAISTLLVYKMQQSRTITPDDLEFDMNEYYQKAEEVQVHLAGIAPEASQAKRHHQLLGRLKQRANRAQSRTASRPRPGTNVDVEFPCATRADDETSNDVDHTMVAPSAISNDQLTPNEFDFAFMDDTPWQFLDQLNSLDNSDLWSIG